ncbi:hypothetical protein [Chromobacterium violaceum]|nr:hypothetical protein [Chromobacterium violaceum]
MDSKIVIDAKELKSAFSVAVEIEDPGMIVDKDDGRDLDIGDAQPKQEV